MSRFQRGIGKIHPMRWPALLLLALTACSTPEAFDRRIAGHVGETEAELIAALGVPDGAYTAPDGRRFLQYERLGSGSSVTVSPGIGLGFAGGSGWSGFGLGTGLGFGFGGPPPPCRVLFELQGGRVVRFDRAGPGCVASA